MANGFCDMCGIRLQEIIELSTCTVCITENAQRDKDRDERIRNGPHRNKEKGTARPYKERKRMYIKGNESSAIRHYTKYEHKKKPV